MASVLTRFLIAFNILGISPRDYIVKFTIPLISMGIAFPVVMQLLTPELVVGAVVYVLYMIPLVFVSLVLFYPLSLVAAKEVQINQNMHYFVTHMGVLATADIGHKEIIKQLSENEAYEYLAEEMRRIYTLMDNWNLSFAQACRFNARRTPSEILADFLDRMAHSADSGMELEDFLKSEQIVVMADFETMYRGALNTIDMIKEMYTSMVMALIFLASFAVITPLLIGIEATSILIGSVCLFLGMEALVVYFTKLRVPKDPIWHSLDIMTQSDQRMLRALPISLVGCFIAGILVFLYGKLPVSIMVAVSLTPLAYTGFVAGIEESKVKRKDLNFQSFIRSLGSSAGARAGSITDTLGKLISHDFGPLSIEIKDLFRRLKTGISKKRSWQYFAAGAGSNLIERFGTIFVEGTHQGGKADIIGYMISDNVVRILSLRKLRYQSAANLVGVLYGLTAGISFTMFTSLSIVDILNEMYSRQESLAAVNLGLNLSAAGIDVQTMVIVLMAMMVGHSLLSSIMVRVVDGGHMFNAYLHFVGMVWASSICGEVAMRCFRSLLMM